MISSTCDSTRCGLSERPDSCDPRLASFSSISASHAFSSVLSSSKPWLAWPKSLNDVLGNASSQTVFSYLTSARVRCEILEETRRHFFQAFLAKKKEFLEEDQDEGENAEEGKLKEKEQRNPDGGEAKVTENGAVVLMGGRSEEWNLYSSDCSKATFRQEAFFRYLIGVEEPDLLAVIDLQTRDIILFVPHASEACQRFNGPPRSAEWYKATYSLTDVEMYTEAQVIRLLKARNIQKLFLLHGINSDSGNTPELPMISGFTDFRINKASLYPLLSECRVHKTPLEVNFLRFCSLVSSQAHVYVLRRMQEGMTEVQAEALFRSYVCFAGAARHVAYDCICGSGPNGAILHYGHAGRPNDRVLKANDMLLFDMGGDYAGYATDITCSFPVSPTFSTPQRVVYSAVLDAQKAVEMAMKPGVWWPDMHRLAERIILQHLKAAGLLQGDITAMTGAFLGAVFMPHGLGHFMGLDTHDVGGFNRGYERLTEPGVSYLRTTRHLEEGMVITVEPGCYFVEYLIDKASKDPTQRDFLNLVALAEYQQFGGVRLEDDVLVTNDGIEILTIVPREIDDVEEILRLARSDDTTGSKKEGP